MKVFLSMLTMAALSGYLINTASATSSDLQIITVGKLKAAPSVDGSADDWQDVTGIKIPLTYLNKPELTKTVTLKAGVFGDEVFFYSEWEDSTEDTQHKPHVWDETQQKYVEGPQREDRFALEFAMVGDYDANWFSGKEFKADMWNWKAGRTNPIGIAHDKMTIISKQPMQEAYKTTLPDGSDLYIQRPSDADREPYVAKRYFKKQQDIMPKYLPLEEALPPSSDDVKAKGVWKDGKWHLEQRRKLNTGFADDVRFIADKPVTGAIAVFDHDDNERHFISTTLRFQF
ncbi:MAG TPA: ethylbenzene dehydrogenase-related protein [Candidatus Thiothrix moscowensis]|uniref:ethylbenzene dehydrogenase-related protein n=1 Tax=unclassified Thiothrix TaxID=2636184 RepID=UPI0025E27CD8|nr:MULTISPECIES: ethylbenzene dehydrogenase-related protein [unclassified Thiothrix]HRJ51602.1 ethylbenzene dehydrogenase-related protein [Candidatus Thiothrix moscowensis]HRJ91917.1 ethylbenzene dehydrogenase-related protein [Candidatus Thiothrix moscowensis]